MSEVLHITMKLELLSIKYRFSILSISLYAFFLVLLVSLGFWQLDRAKEKRVFIKKQQQAAKKDVIKLESLINHNTVEYRYRKIELTGVYDSQHQFLLDNQIVNGQAGYFILTPFYVEGLNQAVLVNRGWLVLNKNRKILPDLSITTKRQKLVGRVNQFPSVGIILAGAEIPTEGWPSVVQIIDSQVLSKKLAYPLMSMQIELDSDMNEGYYRKWKQLKVMPAEKHIAYAVQWFGLAITLTFLFIWFSRTVDE